jgi:hypothetical protein
MWCWKRMEKIIWTDRVRNEVLHGVKEERNIVHNRNSRKAKWIGDILRRNCLLKHDVEGKNREDAEDGIRSYWMTLRKRVDTGN